MSQWVNDCVHYTKALYRLMSELAGWQSINHLPDPTTESIAEEFADYFIDKINKICSDLEKHDKYKPLHMSLQQILSNFKPMTNEHDIRTINSMTTKSCESDSIPTTIFKKVAPFIIDEITAIINIYLQWGCLCKPAEKCHCLPSVKKGGSRPYSWKIIGLSVASQFYQKWLRSACLEQLTNHHNNQDLMPNCKSTGYRTNYSCETVLVKLTSDILNVMKYQKAMALVVLDLGVAFDTVDHSILLEVLFLQIWHRW